MSIFNLFPYFTEKSQEINELIFLINDLQF
jgi:hypothetical protein